MRLQTRQQAEKLTKMQMNILKQKQTKQNKKLKPETDMRNRKEERKKRTRDNQERGSEKGEANKRLKRNKRRHRQINKNALFEGETQVCLLETKKGKLRKKNKTKT